jgi:hypothetical protein
MSKQIIEFDVRSYLRTGNLQCNPDIRTNMFYIEANNLFAKKMLSVLLSNNLPKGTYYCYDYFAFNDVYICIDCLIEMYRTLQQVDKYRSWASLYIKMFEERIKKDV